MLRIRKYLCGRPRTILLGITVLFLTIWTIVFVFLHGSNPQSAIPAESGNTTDVTSVLSTTRPITTTTLPSADSYIPLVLIFTQADRNPMLLLKLIRCLRSIFAWNSSVNLIFISDKKSFDLAEAAIKRNVTSDKAKLRISYLNLEDAVMLSRGAIEPIKKHFSSNNSYYSQTVFFLSVVMHQILPFHNRVLYVDIDVVFQTDIANLFGQFEKFTSENLMGLAFEQQPVYRHVLQSYRKSHPNSTFGAAPPVGQPGFNSGVVLFDLQKMRSHEKYLAALGGVAIANLSQKYSFQGHLGDQDFFSLLSFEHPQWFYVLPCEWNRQLCVWWKNNGYSDVFKTYHACAKTPLIYHGNCNTRIPFVSVNNETKTIK